MGSGPSVSHVVTCSVAATGHLMVSASGLPGLLLFFLFFFLCCCRLSYLPFLEVRFLERPVVRKVGLVYRGLAGRCWLASWIFGLGSSDVEKSSVLLLRNGGPAVAA